ncbi:Dyp-type peroxidase [Actinomadura kijaniata]|uniref:Dyp-type peroxidase n=1 Tax=Actinomadura kijaniata TaxID=46161 RepID=UPI000AE54703|nr:Dyp-type peroxidase [Actinomadura kijaniata]
MTGGTGGLGRRRLLGAASLVGGGLVAGAAGAQAVGATRAEPGRRTGRSIPFDGEHQAGILAPPAAHGRFTAFDLEPKAGRAEVTALLKAWTDAARRLTAGAPVPGDAPIGYGPASLTVTVGFGASLLRRIGAPVPAELEPLPAFPRDAIDPRRSDGDLGVLVTADDAFVVAHALRVLAAAGRGTARPRWQMTGFSTADGTGATPRNLMGRPDGSGNPRPDDPGFDRKVFAAGPAWMRGGSYLVFRRIRMLLDDWERLPRHRREQIIGRRADTGAPLSGGTESTAPDLRAQNPDGSLAIAAGAHVRQSSPLSNSGATLLRKGLSYFDGYRPDGAPDAGLLFIAFQADPRDGFTRVQQRLARADDLSRFVRHESSALFAVPHGCRPGRYLGQDLMEGR